MTKKKMITKNTLELLHEKFNTTLPKVQEEFTPKEALLNLSADIRRLVETQGYSYSDIANILKEHDLDLTVATIRSYLRSNSIGNKKSEAKAGRTALGIKSVTTSATIAIATDPRLRNQPRESQELAQRAPVDRLTPRGADHG